MKKLGLNKRNSNPPWPDEQPIVVIPPGSNAASVGMPDSRVRIMKEEMLDSTNNTHAESGMLNESMTASRNNAAANNSMLEESANSRTRNGMTENSFKTPESNIRYPQRNTADIIRENELRTSAPLRHRQVRNDNDDRRFPIMGLQENGGIGMALKGMGVMPLSGGCLDSVNVNGYLCSHIGKYVKIEFVFGEQTHVEKTGILREVGRNFVVIREMGTNNDVVCAINKIKFITIYNMSDNNTMMTE